MEVKLVLDTRDSKIQMTEIEFVKLISELGLLYFGDSAYRKQEAIHGYASVLVAAICGMHSRKDYRTQEEWDELASRTIEYVKDICKIFNKD